MDRISIVFLLVIFFSCGQESRYTEHEINGVKVKIDSRITTNKKKAIVQSVEYDLGTESGFHIENLTEIKYDSLLFSYLITLRTEGDINPTKLHLMKAYSELLSKDALVGRPVHIFVANTGQYIEYDTTVMKSQVGNASELGRLRLETKNVGNYLNSRIAKLLEKSLRQVKFDGPLIATLKADSNVYSVDFVLDPQKHKPTQFRDSIGAIDPYHKFLILDNDELFVNFKDSTGRTLTGSVHFQ
ncbi:MAG TPA: hypothetical protein VEA37_00770 [Flavobacterium sp.]|nr:hypothetical protein [Flavobacterium sp.]